MYAPGARACAGAAGSGDATAVVSEVVWAKADVPIVIRTDGSIRVRSNRMDILSIASN
jgi:hypothetical protein